MSGVDPQELAARLMVVEYEQLKEEQRDRIGFRDNLLYANLVALAAVVAATSTRGGAWLLLLLPPVSTVLGWTYVVNDEKVSAIGRYIRAELRAALGAMTDRACVFGWEEPGTDRHRFARKRRQLCVDLLAFCVLPLAALVVFWATVAAPAPLVILSAAEVAPLAVLAEGIVRHADLSCRAARRDWRAGR
jgi:hypothetical protein